ncbi:helix-turn-helix transcriptional regulator [Pacificoceanicola onchidii]|uniref:helix-turn-helix transcriptional regulator n=1 Tax=Pacificoceanicola onchidii TaxID=2562685 RepID=UPI001F0EE4E9|nr:hypothetical protein [Pacificoceanicola onchidii]
MIDSGQKPINAEMVLTNAASSLSAAAEALVRVGNVQERSHKPSTPKRGLTRNEAAYYIGVSVKTFDRLVQQRVMPKPIKKFSRAIWDLNALDNAFERFAATDDENPWN